MADYQSLLTRAVANLPSTSSAATRQAIYDRARKALLTQLRTLRPPLPESDITREEKALDQAIALVEAKFGAADAAQPELTPSAPASAGAGYPAGGGSAASTGPRPALGGQASSSPSAPAAQAQAAPVAAARSPEPVVAKRPPLPEPPPAKPPATQPAAAQTLAAQTLAAQTLAAQARSRPAPT